MESDAPEMSSYSTEVQVSSQSGWGPGLPLELGFYLDHDNIPQPLVLLAGEDISANVSFSVDGSRDLVLSIDLSSEAAIACEVSPGIYLVCTATFSLDGKSFNGGITALCSGAATLGWRGVASLGTDATERLFLALRRRVEAVPRAD